MNLKLNYLRLLKMLSKYTLYGILMQTCFYTFLLAEDSAAQRKSVRDVYVTVNDSYNSVNEVFKTIESQTDFEFAYSKRYIPRTKNISLTSGKRVVKEVLLEISRECRLKFKQVNNSISVNILPGDLYNNTGIVEIVQPRVVTGTVTSEEDGLGLPGVNILIKGTNNGTITDVDGKYRLEIPGDDAVLVFSSIGFQSQEIAVANQSDITVSMSADIQSLEEIIVVGYGTQKKESLTGAISNVQSKDLERVHSATTSGMLAGKMAGVSFRQPDGRPGQGAWLQIRNMGTPLFVIDGIQKDEGQFNNIAPQDIESITILKDASAAIYGVRAANGVVVVTTKKGSTNQKSTVNVNTYYGVQNWSRFPKGVDAYSWMAAKAEAEMNLGGNTPITSEELEKWKAGTEPGYQSFDWYDFIVGKNAPQSSININASGGSENTNYYLSVSRFDQDAVFDDFTFNRTNLQANVDTKIAKKLKVGTQINGRIETRDNPGVPGYDDYWQPRFALFRNRPTERPYANDNPEYPNHISNIETNWALLNKEVTGWWRSDWRVLQTNFTGEYEIMEGLTAKGMYSYYFADQLTNTFEYTYDVFTYDQNTDSYNRTGGNDNPYRDRTQEKINEHVTQFQLAYNNTFGKHTIGAVAVAESIQRRTQRNFLHSVPQTNYLDLIQFADMDTYDDSDYEEARLGYIGRINYDFDSKYYFEVSGRYDGSWKFAPDKRWGFFPSVSGGWRISREDFFDVNWVSNLKLRASYGELGDDNVGIGSFDYIPGYNYAVSKVILDGNVIPGSANRGKPIDNISWFTSTILDIGFDFSLFDDKITGTVDYFKRTREGLRGRKYDVVLPAELGYSLPDENLNSDAQFGYEGTLRYTSSVNGLKYSIGGNISYARSKFLSSYKPRWGNSWDHYRNSQEDRYQYTFWGYEVTGQFQSQEEINNYPINIDNEGNKTLLPGDFIYKDINNDGKIDGFDQRPIGYGTGRNPIVNFGINLSLEYKGFDFTADFSGGTMYGYNQNWEMRWPFQNGGNLLSTMYDDRWHRADLYDLNSEWIPGANPALRFNTGWHSNYNKNSTWWMVNITYLRMRTMELGYTIPTTLTQKIKLQKARVYVNTYNLFSIDNVHQLGIDPEVADENGLQYPQNKLFNLGVNLTF